MIILFLTLLSSSSHAYGDRVRLYKGHYITCLPKDKDCTYYDEEHLKNTDKCKWYHYSEWVYEYAPRTFQKYYSCEGANEGGLK